MNITILRMCAAAVLVLGGLGAFLPHGALADTMEMEADKYSALKEFADRRFSETKVPGAGVGIIKDGKVIFAGGFGTRDLNTGEPINSQTAYLIGSSTKPFTVTRDSDTRSGRHSRLGRARQDLHAIVQIQGRICVRASHAQGPR